MYFPRTYPSDYLPKDLFNTTYLIPGAILPNKPAHRMNRKEAMEVEGPVEELVSKTLVRESLSPCVILALPRRMEA